MKSKVQQTAALVKFNFHGDELDVASGDGVAHVVIRRVCEHLGVDFSSQLAKLKSDPSAVVAMIPTTGPDGKNYETACLDVRSLPLWLATIHPSKVKPAVREKLVRYRRECADVLADHFLGRRGAASGITAEQVITIVTEANKPLAAALERLVGVVEMVARRVDALEARPANVLAVGPGIGAREARKIILAPLCIIARLKARIIGKPKAWRKLRLHEERALRRELDYPMDARQRWEHFPKAREAEAINVVARMRDETDRLAEIAGVSLGDQGDLFVGVGANDVRRRTAN
jgi:hypothetical protein